jgi:hypothetical protein
MDYRFENINIMNMYSVLLQQNFYWANSDCFEYSNYMIFLF